MADDVKSHEDECALPPSKRKPDADSYLVDDQPKKFKTEIGTDIVDGEPPPSAVKPDGEDEDDSEDEEHSNGEAEIDRKGKGILTSRDDKGKGKMVEEDDGSDDDVVGGGGDEDDDDDDDSSDEDDDDSGDEDDDSDLSDDPLTEVDLDNILPSRTRRRSAASGGGIFLGKEKDN